MWRDGGEPAGDALGKCGDEVEEDVSGPLVNVVTAVLDRTASLIEKGVSPAKALRQAARDLEEYEKKCWNKPITNERIDLGAEPQKRAA